MKSDRKALLRLSAGQTAAHAATTVGLTSKAVREIGRRYGGGGLERARVRNRAPGAAPPLELQPQPSGSKRDISVAKAAYRALFRSPTH